MSDINYVIDAHFPRKLVWLFKEHGIMAYHTLGMPNENYTTDQQILQFAEDNNCVVMTKDSDFVDSFYLHNRPKKLLLISTGNIRNADLLMLLQHNLPKLVTLFASADFIELTLTNIIIHN